MANTNKKSKQNLSESDSENEILIEFSRFIEIKSLEENTLAICLLSWLKRQFPAEKTFKPRKILKVAIHLKN